MRELFKKIFLSVFIGSLVTIGFSSPAFAAGFTITGDKNGLEIRVPDKTIDTGNLNPGDMMNSCLEIANTGSKTITVYIRTNILSEESPLGGPLADVMTLTIKDGGNTIADNAFRAVAGAGDISLGKMAPGSVKEICFASDLPEGTGNDYQGSSFKANWTFTTQVSGGGGGGGGGTGGGEDYYYYEPEAPGLSPGEEELVINPEAPGWSPEMPGTGVEPPYLYYALGAMALLSGTLLIRKPKRRRRR